MLFTCGGLSRLRQGRVNSSGGLRCYNNKRQVFITPLSNLKTLFIPSEKSLSGWELSLFKGWLDDVNIIQRMVSVVETQELPNISFSMGGHFWASLEAIFLFRDHPCGLEFLYFRQAWLKPPALLLFYGMFNICKICFSIKKYLHKNLQILPSTMQISLK